jgi:hypothetical protein
MPKRDWPPLVCFACGHVIGERDGFVYRVVDGREGVWCPGCVPQPPSSADREDAGYREAEVPTGRREA